MTASTVQTLSNEGVGGTRVGAPGVSVFAVLRRGKDGESGESLAGAMLSQDLEQKTEQHRAPRPRPGPGSRGRAVTRGTQAAV